MALSASLLRTIAAVALFGALAGSVSAKPKGSLPDSDIEAEEAKVTLGKALEENALLKEQLTLLKEKLTVAEAESAKMTESVANAQSEAEVFRREGAQLKLKLEALGVEGVAGNQNKVEQRLLQAVNDLRIAEDERKKFAEALTGMTETLITYLKNSVSKDPESRLTLEAQLRRSHELLGTTPSGVAQGAPVVATLNDGMVIGLKDELSLVVANIGTKHGVKIGMPFQILRNDHIIGTVRVVDVRDKICGAVIQDLTSEKDKIKQGDRLKVAASQ